MNTKNSNALIGFTDRPFGVDYLGTEKYFSAISAYIKNCTMPMTISIQGDWGTGKTTAIKIIQEKLQDNKDILCLNIEMWPYTVYEQGGNISIAFLEDFCEKLQESKVIQKDRIETMKSFLRAGIGMLGAFMGADGAREAVDEIADAGRRSIVKVNEILKFRNEIEEAIPDGQRLVVFVDDLDRLSPRLAMEVLELLKNFVDCGKCVFVLAIDFEVVSRGVKIKYGDDFDDEKARNFFDKLIQLQFHLPVSAYDIKNYLIHQFGISEKYVEKYEDAIIQLMDSNPRKIKRAFNLLNLYELVLGTTNVGEEKKIKLLILILIQLHDIKLYEDLLERKDEAVELYRYFKDNRETETYLESVDSFLGLEIFREYEENEVPYNEDNMKAFMENLKNTAYLSNVRSYDNDKENEMKIGEFVRYSINNLIKDELLTEDILKNLQDSKWCSNQFSLGYPFFVEKIPEKTDNELGLIRGGYKRYWKDTYKVEEKEYYLCSQWYKSQRKNFEEWIDSVKGTEDK